MILGMLETLPSGFVKVWVGEFVQLGRSVIDERLVELLVTEFVPVNGGLFVALMSLPPRMIVGSAAAAPMTPIIVARTENAKTEERPMMI